MKIICIGRNYADHAKELNNALPTEPVIFLKPETALIPKRNPFFIPDFSKNVQYELELVVRINKIGKHIQEKFAANYYHQITVGLDFTARDLQQELKEKGLPWEKAKAFDNSAMLGKWIDLADNNIQDLNIKLFKNEIVAQKVNTGEMLFSVNKIISEVSKYFTLKIGDVIFTGTPSGVGQVLPNDNLRGFIAEQELFNLNVK